MGTIRRKNVPLDCLSWAWNSISCSPELAQIVDMVGEASQIAQALQRPVTTVPSFYGSNQTLYLMKDAQSNRGLGSIIGLLKVGPKKLFLLDKRGQQNELTPLCVLDFYVHESRQRMGIGKQIYEFVLQAEKMTPVELAIDRPSAKLLGFLRKHYNLVNIIPQVNNFVIYDGFFNSCIDPTSSSSLPTNRYSARELTTWPCKPYRANLRHASSMKSVFWPNDSPFTSVPVSTSPERQSQPHSPFKNPRPIRVEEDELTAPTPFSSPSKTFAAHQPSLPSLSSQNKWASMAVLPSVLSQAENPKSLTSPTRKLLRNQTAVSFQLWETEEQKIPESHQNWLKPKESGWKSTSIMDVNENSQNCLNRELPAAASPTHAPQLKHHHHHALW